MLFIRKFNVIYKLRNCIVSRSSTSHDQAKAAGLSYRDGELYLQFPFCPCPMLAEVDRLETNTWCQCTAGYSKVIFGKAFGCEVDVELLKIACANVVWKRR